MHVKRFALLIFALLFLGLSLSPGPVEAAGPPWEAWLYNDAVGRMTKVDGTQTVVQQLTLPSVRGDVYPRQVTVSRNGALVAYSLFNNGTGERRFQLVDTSTNSVVFSHSLPNNPGAYYADSYQFSHNEFVFSSDNSKVAFGYSMDTQWEILVFDTASGNVQARLQHTDPLLNQFNLQQGLTPVVQNFQGTHVLFTLIRAGTEGAPVYPAFDWDYSAGTIQANAVFRTLANDIFERTAEVVLAVRDQRLPDNSGAITGPGWQNNALHVSAPPTPGTFPFYNDRNYSFYRPRFIQDGTRILVGASDVTSDNASWRVLERNGVSVGTLPIGGMNLEGIEGLQDGFVYSADTGELVRYIRGLRHTTNTTALMYVQTTQALANNFGTIMWTGNPGDHPVLVWARDLRGSSQTPTTSWAQLAAPVTNNSMVSASGKSGGTSGGSAGSTSGQQPQTLTVGAPAGVNTTEGDMLNVRSGPGTDFGVLERLNDGTRVDLLEGPVDAGGFRWWRIRTPSGVEGWVVEAADNVQVLIPWAGETASAGAPPQTPEPNPPSTGGSLQVGGQAIVTQAGGNLNVRSQPGTSFPVLSILGSGDVVDVLAGPRQADGFTWWRVTTPEGPGWAAEGSAGEQWLAPR